VNDARGALGALYGTRFAGSFGTITLLTLLPTYIDLYDPSGLVVGLFTTALTLASTVAVVPLAWAGDRYDKRTVLLAAVGASVVAYAAYVDLYASIGGENASRTVHGSGARTPWTVPGGTTYESPAVTVVEYSPRSSSVPSITKLAWTASSWLCGLPSSPAASE
jgi:MFS family permease